LVEQRTENPRVTSSSLVPGKIHFDPLTVHYSGFLKHEIKKSRFMKNLCSTLVPSIPQNLLFNEKVTLLCAFSGGQDSTVLFFLLLHCLSPAECIIRILYCHHFWQRENFYSYSLTFRLCGLFNIPFSTSFAVKIIRTETLARSWRQESYDRQSFLNGTQTLVLGHTTSDQSETAFSHVIRGTSPRGSLSLHSSLSQKRLSRARGGFENNISMFHSAPKDIRASTLKSSKTKIWQSSYGEKWGQKLIPLSCLSFYTHSRVVENKDPDPAPGVFIDKALGQLASRPSCRIFIFSQQQPCEYLYPVFSYDFFFNRFEKISLQRLRPLISLHRTDVKYAVTTFQFPFIYDLTNTDYRYRRNQIRYRLIPFIRYLFGPYFDQNFYHFMQLSHKDQLILGALEQKICCDLYQNSFDISSPIDIPLQLQTHLLYRVLCLYGNRTGSNKFLDQIIKQL
jgi:tRNA(Ile)-lysidine synthase TilS/MesJ